MRTLLSRIAIFVAALALAPVLLASTSMQRDMLLAPDGTLYTVTSVPASTLSGVDSNASQSLLLTVQNGSATSTAVVPASLNAGYHFAPALAYDSVSNTLFIFWEAMTNAGFTSDLMFCSYRNGAWGASATLDSVAWDLRENLKIAITRRTEITDWSGAVSSIPEITVHAVWWQQSGAAEWARYAMLTTDGGTVTNIQVKNLTDFVAAPELLLANPVDNQLLRHPIVLESPAHDTVDVVFGDLRRDSMHRVTLKPVANGRLRIPVGVRDVLMPPTPNFNLASADGFSGIAASNGSLAFYFFTGPQSVNYVLFKDGAWSPLRAIPVSDNVSQDAAVEALRRMIASE